ncbi:MAG: hypothetical protein MJ182_08425 [Treponema sp.]|nr:hypothetical protein [Treponema sp.]
MILLMIGCSSAPKRQMVYTDVAQHAYDNYEKANGCITRGEYEKAEKYLEDSYAQAVSIDKNDLICKILLSGISYRIQNPVVDLSEKAFALPSDVDTLLSEARFAAAQSDEKIRPLLESIIRVYDCRVKLFKAQNGVESYGNSEIQKILDGEIKNLSKDPYYLAFLYRTKGDWSHFLMNYKAAAENYKTAADVHTKNLYLYEIAYDWYLCASSYSKDGKKQEAVSAIQNALKYDRDAENSMAIAQDYLAAAHILVKGTSSQTEREKALFYAKKAESIFRSTGNLQKADDCIAWITENK